MHNNSNQARVLLSHLEAEIKVFEKSARQPNELVSQFNALTVLPQNNRKDSLQVLQNTNPSVKDNNILKLILQINRDMEKHPENHITLDKETQKIYQSKMSILQKTCTLMRKQMN